VDLVHRAVDRTWGWFTVNQGRQWPTACRCAALPEFWFTGLRCKGPRSKRASWGTCFGGHRTAGGGGIGRHRRMVATAFGAHHGVDWSGEEGIWEWGSARRGVVVLTGPLYRLEPGREGGGGVNGWRVLLHYLECGGF
jgi:hypothetical protein